MGLESCAGALVASKNGISGSHFIIVVHPFFGRPSSTFRGGKAGSRHPITLSPCEGRVDQWVLRKAGGAEAPRKLKLAPPGQVLPVSDALFDS